MSSSVSWMGTTNGDGAGAQFASDLQATLVPRSSGGDVTPTFTRATTAYVLGYLTTIAAGPTYIQCASGEARFMGARRIAQDNWSIVDSNGVALTTTNGASALCTDAGGPFGYLSEGAATNLALQSQTMAAWATFSSSTAGTPNTDVAPDGTTTAEALLEDATVGVPHYADVNSVTFSISTAYTLSAHIKQKTGTRNCQVLFYTNGGGDQVTMIVNPSTGAIVTAATAVGSMTSVSGTVTAEANGWYKVTVTGTTFTAAGIGAPRFQLVSGTTLSYNGDGASGFLVWGVQLETGSFATSYIPTTTVAVARNADVDQYVSAGNLNTTAMTVALEITPSTALGSAGANHFATYVDASNYTIISSDGNNLYAQKVIGGVGYTAFITWNNRSAGTTVKVAARFDTVNGVDVWLNGTKGTGDATVGGKAASQIGTNFQIGTDGNGTNQDFCGHRNFRVYPVALPASKLVSMTS